MTKKEWQAIEEARRLLGLGERAARKEIKRAYHCLSKQYHPDTSAGEDQEMMYRLTTAYELLMRYCEQYRFPLVPEDGHLDAKDWWMDRFGSDPLWGRRS